MKNEIRSIIYQIFVGENLEEFYTYSCPIIKNDQVNCKNLIIKGSVTQEILGKKVDEYYKLDWSGSEDGTEIKKAISFHLKNSFSIKLLDVKELEWLDMKKEDAEKKLKDKLLEQYTQIVPSLIQDFNILQKELSNLKNSKTPINKNKDLLI